MANPINSDFAQFVSEWISQQAEKMHFNATVYKQNIVRAGDWFNVPVWIDFEGDAYDRASMLQRIEEAWEPADHEGIQIFLLPAKPGASSTVDLYTQIMELADRQHQILDSIRLDTVDAEMAKRLLAVKQEWLETRSDTRSCYALLAH